jgi:N-acetylneuraminate synthase
VVGPGKPCYVIAEIGINHNGDIDIAKKLINVASGAGCDAVKFQKRTIDVVYSPEELAKPRESPFGDTNGDLKRGLEFEIEEYREIDRYCREVKIDWFASCWDEASVDFIAQFQVPCFKVASASLTDDKLLRHTRAVGKPVLLSTGMSTIQEVDHAVEFSARKISCFSMPAVHIPRLRRIEPARHRCAERAIWRAGWLLRPRNRIALERRGRGARLPA